MNLTPDKFVAAVEHCAQELPNIINEWDKLDFDLKEDYADQMRWMLTHRCEAAKLSLSFDEAVVAFKRLESAVDIIYIYKDFICNQMGWDVDQIEISHLNKQIEYYQSVTDDFFIFTLVNTDKIEDEIHRLQSKTAELMTGKFEKKLDEMNAKLDLAVAAARELLKR